MLSIQPKIAVLNVPGFVSKQADMLDYARDLCPNADVEWIDKADINPYVTSNLGPACPQHDSCMIAFVLNFGPTVQSPAPFVDAVVDEMLAVNSIPERDIDLLLKLHTRLGLTPTTMAKLRNVADDADFNATVNSIIDSFDTPVHHADDIAVSDALELTDTSDGIWAARHYIEDLERREIHKAKLLTKYHVAAIPFVELV